MGQPPSTLSWNPHSRQPRLSFDGESVGYVTYSLFAKQVRVRWTNSSRMTQPIATEYWPTSVDVLADHRTLIVGGKRENGNTVIETWRFDRPEVVRREGVPPQLVDAEIRERRTVYDAAVQGRDLVAHVFANMHSATSAFVQFYDSRALYAFDLSTAVASPKLVAVKSGGTGSVLTIPRLADDFDDLWSKERLGRGFVYVFGRSHSDSVATLVLIDADKNGSIDSWTAIASGKQWSSDGWGDSANYVQ